MEVGWVSQMLLNPLLNLKCQPLQSAGVRGQSRSDAKPGFWRKRQRWREKEKERGYFVSGGVGGGVGFIHRDRLSGKAREVRGEDLLFMLETGQG